MPSLFKQSYFQNIPSAPGGRGRIGFGFEVDVQGDAQIVMHFDRVAERSLDLRPAFFAIHEDMLRIEREQFSSEGQFRSGGWAPLSESTIARREALGLGTRILDATGRLMRSLTDSSGSDHRFFALKSSMLFGSNVPYIEAQMKGIGDVMPARPPIAFNEIDREGWLRIIKGWIVSGTPTKTEATERAGARLASTLAGDWS